jgi:ligand-binding sensor domain-containing protein/anti-sigma regulatory factor (Ser/Thr protein kinase)
MNYHFNFFKNSPKITTQLKKLLQILIIPLLLWNGTIVAQSISYGNLTTEEGLPSNTVYQIKQDKKGFIWIATANGLVRYDGRDFQLFNPKKIKDKDILGLFIDNENQVWFWNMRGQLFYIKNKNIYTAFIDNKKVINFIQDKKGIYWFVAKGDGLYQLSNNKKEVKLIEKKASLQSLQVYEDNILTGYSSMQYVFSDNKKIGSFDMTNSDRKVQFIKEKFNFKILNHHRYTIQTPENYIYLLDENGFFASRPFKQYEKSLEGTLVDIYQDNNDNYWVMTTSDTYIFDKNYQVLDNSKLFLRNEKVTYYFNDKEGNHWIVIKDKGIKIIPSIYFLSDDFSQILLSVNSLYLNQNDLLIGTDNGKLLIKNLKTKTLKILQFEGDFTINGINESTLEDKFWLNSFSKSIYLNADYSIKMDNIGLGIISYKTIWNKGKNDPLFIGNYGGVLRIPANEIPYFLQINQNKMDITWYDLRLRYRVKGINHRTYAIEKVKDEFWFGSMDGLYYYKKDSAVLSSIKELQNSWITHIVNQKDTVWVGTQTNGVFQIINKKVRKVFNETNGLVSNNCKSLIVELNGIVWVGTNNGINKINTNTGEVDLINNLDGLLSNDVNDLVVSDKSVFVATAEGLVTFDKNIQTKNKVAPPIYLSKFQIFDKDTVLQDNYVLRHNQNNIRIHFTGVSFRSQGTFKYKYRMKPIVADWVETQSNIVSFPILNSGKYFFEAYAINEDGVESEVPIRISIIVKAPFWQTWWFWLLVGGLVLFIVWWIIQTRIRRIEERLELENEFQQKINELKMQALQAQMNPHFIFNALNAIQHYLITGKGEQATIYLAKFAKLIRMIFEYSKQISIVLTDEVDFLKLYLELEKLRFKNKVAVDFLVSSDVYTDDFNVPPLVIQPIIENCFKHGLLHKESNSKIKITFTNENGWIKCVVEDNGIGREKAKTMQKYKSKKHNSSGLKITKERLNIWINQQKSKIEQIDCFKIIDLKDENGNASGTRIEMILGKMELE